MAKELLISDADYKASGIYIGMKQRTAQMREYIYRVRPDGLSLLNIGKIDQKIRTAAKFIARHKKIMIVARKNVAHEAAKKFGEITGANSVVGRFMPGTLTNPAYKKFFEADVVLVVDPLSDYQALNEAVKARIPVIGICDTFNDTKQIDLVIPSNNKSVRALATLFWILAREVLKERGEINSDEEYKHKIEDFAGDMSLDDQEEETKKQFF
jgi:small subunit ribosomal protein S2